MHNFQGMYLVYVSLNHGIHDFLFHNGLRKICNIHFHTSKGIRYNIQNNKDTHRYMWHSHENTDEYIPDFHYSRECIYRFSKCNRLHNLLRRPLLDNLD